MTIRDASRCLLLWALACVPTIADAAQPVAAAGNAATPTLEQIVARYVDARGGADAWQRILAMGWTGHIESGAEGSQKIPFLMLFRKPDATRFEVVVQNQRSVRIFDGHRGWKQRPGGESGVELTDYTPEDVRAALDSGGLDGPLSGYKAKGVQLELQGAELIEQRKAWKIKVTFPSGDVQWHWIDADNYHDLRYDREVRNAMGTRGIVSVYFRNYQAIEGVTLPLLIETQAPAGQAPNRMIIERVAINPTLNADTFERPVQAGVRHNGITVNTGDPRGGGVPRN
jgi:hypothetical protein